MKNRDITSTASKANFSQSRNHMRDGKFPDLEKALIKWTQLTCSTNVSIDGNFLKKKKNFCPPPKKRKKKMNIYVDFKASDGWFEKFKSRHDTECRNCFGRL